MDQLFRIKNLENKLTVLDVLLALEKHTKLKGLAVEIEKISASPCEPHIIGRACEKCGSREVSITYVPVHGGYLSRDGYVHSDREFLHIRCKICSFDWKQNTLDQK